MSAQKKKSSPSSFSSSISSGNLPMAANVHPSTLGNIPSHLLAGLPNHHNHAVAAATRTNNGDESETFSQFGNSLIPSTPKPREIWYAQETNSKTVANTRHIITSICTNYLFPKVKFLNHRTDLDFSYNRKSICQHILHRCNLAPSINKQAWWSHNSKLLMMTLTSLRNNKTRSICSLFYGTFFDERYLIQLCSYNFFVFVSRLVAYNR